jgi:hypothetical protein
MTERELIYRHEKGAPWDKTQGAALKLPLDDDDRALAVKFIYWPNGLSDSTAMDSGGLVFEICEWCKILSPEGEVHWNVRFRRAVAVAGTVSALFKDHDVALAGGIRQLFGRGTIIEVEGFAAETEGKPYLSITGGKGAMARFYGVDPASITVTLQQ